MIRTPRAGASLLVALSLVTTSLTPLTAAQAQTLAASKLGKGQWAQARSDIKPDPDILFGALPNGMRYALRRQTTPPNQASIRLWFNAGALMENDQQQGLAHFLEHMAFNGSKAVKEGDMIKMLERLGLSFGGDTNASTGFEETVYKLDLPRTDDETVDTSLMLMREAAGNLTIDPEAMNRERGVVLSEERSRDTPSYRVLKQRLAFLLPGQRLITRYPIGQVDILKNAPASTLVDFYRHYYRPERAVLVIAGDFDVAKMEQKIRARFSDWKAVGPAGPEPNLGVVQPRKTEAKVVIEPALPLSLQIAWVRPPDTDPDTVAERRQEIVERLGFSVLNRRFSAIGRAANPPFIGAGAGEGDQVQSAEITTVGVSAEPGKWREALAAAEQEYRRAVVYGVRQDELDREIQELRTVLNAAVAGAATRRPAALVGEIVGSLPDNEVVTSPAQDLEMFNAAVKGLTAAEVSAALKAKFSGQGPLLFMSSPQPVDGGEKALLDAFAASQKVAVSPPAALAQVTWPYESFGPAGQVAERQEVSDLGATFVRFANGVRLTVKPTKFRNDEVIVRVNIGNGQLDLPKTEQSEEWISGAYIEGGLKKLSNEDMERVLADKLYSANFGVNDDGFVLVGQTRPSDLPTELQVLTAYVADPAWRPEAFQRLKAARARIHDQLESTTGGVMGRDLEALLHPGDQRWAFPSREHIANVTLDDLKRQVAPHLASDPIEIVVVGDTTVDAAVAAVSRTFGALPPRPAAKPVPASQRQVGFPGGVAEPIVRTHKGRADQAAGYIAWKTTDYWVDPQRARVTAVLGEVLKNRLTDELRESQGATYSPSAGANHSLVWTDWGYVAASVEVPPQKLPEFFSDTQKIASDLRGKPVSDDELARAKKPRIEALQRARVTNQYWLAQLAGAQTDPRRLTIIREQIQGLEKVTAADVQRAAQTFLKDDTAFKLVVRPEAKQP